MKDFLGHEIRKGDTVIYPVRRGSSMWLKRMIVQQVDEQEKMVIGTNDNGRRVNLMRPERSVVVPTYCAYCAQNPFEVE